MGNYFVDEKALKHLEDQGQVVFRYCDENGEPTPTSNPNGSLNNIAGICDRSGRVVGMMPHPERRVNEYLGGCNGQDVFNSIAGYLSKMADFR
jgi:phosphoribosylformylglycinamidine synthase